MSLSDATREVTQMESRLGMPSTVHGFFAGTAQAYQDRSPRRSISSSPRCSPSTSCSASSTRAWCIPFTIISTLPSASVGAMLALMLFNIDLNVISIIGIILLIGIVKKNAIMMIDFALMAEREGRSPPATPSSKPACCASAPS